LKSPDQIPTLSPTSTASCSAGRLTRVRFPGYQTIEPAAPNDVSEGIRQETFAERVLYVKVEDLNAAVHRTVELGGRMVIPPTLVPGVVHFALIEDLAGNRTVGSGFVRATRLFSPVAMVFSRPAAARGRHNLRRACLRPQ
jgi:hypothetical protein